MYLFGVNFEFNRHEIDKKIIDFHKNNKKGYICLVDGNSLSISHNSIEFKNILNNSMLSICDGSSIAFLGGLLKKNKLKTFVGIDFLKKYLSPKRKNMFIGNTEKILDEMYDKLIGMGYNKKDIYFESLPFKNVEDFNYEQISSNIKSKNPDFIWVSLGAPKQEIFMSKILPLINRGILVGVGVSFNFFVNDLNNKRAPRLLLKLNLEWLYRVIFEPKRVGFRALMYLKNIPKLLFQEIKQAK